MNISYDELIEISKSKKEFSVKNERVGDYDVEIFTYNIMLSDTFDSELSKWFRGTVFETNTKMCICRPFPKFFNLNEHEETKEEKLDLNNFQYFPKYDGSLVMPVLFPDGDIYWKSKSTFFSEHAKKAFELFLNSSEEFRKKIIEDLKNGFTPLFELISNNSDFRIVIEYEKEELKYLGKVDIKTGKIFPNLSIKETVNNYKEVYNLEEIEGFVAFNGERLVKLKTKWYLERHKAIYTLSTKSIIQATLENTIDDIIGIVSGLKLYEKLSEIEILRDNVVKEYLKQKDIINTKYESIKDISNRKDFALKVQNLIEKEYQPFMFMLKDNKDVEVAIKKLIINNYLKR